MLAYLARRLAAAAVVVVLVSIIAFGIVSVLPGDTAAALLGEEGARDATRYEALRVELGLDQPIPVRYANWVAGVVTGDLGQSMRTGEDIGPGILARALPTVQLAIMAIIISVVIAIPVGVISAVYYRRLPDNVGTLFALTAIATPGFWFGIMLILLFSVTLRWLPPSGYLPFFSNPIGSLQLMIMPALALATGFTGVLIRQVRSSVLEVLNEDYITTARSKGLSPTTVLFGHALRNALLPVVTLIGLQIGGLFGGAATVETVFSIPGLGRLAVDSIFFRDFTMIQALMLVLALTVLVASLLTDLVYSRIDPRIRRG
ncbi:ABC transporter permease [Devosia ginsengisoli]|uniref:ABC transporter permease n=1 Tax=Devosia ginsengisoli TaxID=400770 RepID=A0A5B8LZF5_9HYPH|nr:ABC transporter permease [Devosia ginsengisoli]QDZ12752.1 ABC transporter permease [Devosia ginsengisoli]